MKQLHLRITFIPTHRCNLTYKKRQVVLELHMFLKQKKDGNIKGQTVAGGNEQRN